MQKCWIADIVEAYDAPSMPSLFDESPQAEVDQETPNAVTLRVIAWLLFAIIAIGGAYLYFNHQSEKHLIERKCTLAGTCTDTDLGPAQ